MLKILQKHTLIAITLVLLMIILSQFQWHFAFANGLVINFQLIGLIGLSAFFALGEQAGSIVAFIGLVISLIINPGSWLMGLVMILVALVMWLIMGRHIPLNVHLNRNQLISLGLFSGSLQFIWSILLAGGMSWYLAGYRTSLWMIYLTRMAGPALIIAILVVIGLPLLTGWLRTYTEDLRPPVPPSGSVEINLSKPKKDQKGRK